MEFTCIECPIGCLLKVQKDGEELLISGNNCPRGQLYAKNEAVCPRRVLTSTIKSTCGRMLPVKTDAPVKKAELLSLMEKLKSVSCSSPIKIGDVIVRNFSENINLVATGNLD